MTVEPPVLTACEGCHNRHAKTRHKRLVQPSGIYMGERHSHVLIIGEAPAKNEDRIGAPMVGATGKELDQYYLPIAGLSRRDVAVTNSMLCSLKGYRNPTKEQAEPCAAHHLPPTLAHVDPDIIVLLGAVACSLAQPQVHLESQHGIPFIGSLYDWVGPILPMYHPAAGMRDDFAQTQLQRDFPVLKKMVYEGLEEHWLSINEDGLDYGVSTADTIAEDLYRCDPFKFAIDTETDNKGPGPDPVRDDPFMLSFSGAEGFARVIMANDANTLDYLFRWVERTNASVFEHNSLFDQVVLRKMDPEGRGVSWKQVRDTQVDAYHARSLEQGLKSLSYRLLGCKMNDYDDVVKPYAAPHQLRYLSEIALHEGKLPQPYLTKGQWKLQRKCESAVIAHIERKVDLQDRFRQWPEEDQWVAEDNFGPFPWTSIRFAPRAESVYYSCQDADITRRLRKPIIERQAEMRLRLTGSS